MRRTFVGASLMVAGVLSACSDTSPSSPSETLPPAPGGVLVSGPGLTSGSLQRGAAASVPTSYVSASPGTFAGAVTAVLRNQTRAGAQLVATVVDGGFDPVAVAAESGDEISIELAFAGGPKVVSIKVPPRRPPRVVRTSPSKGRADVALNVQIVIIFTEPIDKSTLKPTSLSLEQAGSPVEGTLAVAEDGLTATFTPAHNLLPEEPYNLEITMDIRDLDGEPLEQAELIPFTTSADSSVPAPTTDALTGTLAFVSTRDGVAHIYLSNPDGSEVRRLTNSANAEYTPAWSRDGELLAFDTNDGTYVIRRDGSGLIHLPAGGGWPSWSPDGKKLLVSAAAGLRIVPADGSGENETSIDIKLSDIEPWDADWSPDGDRIAFGSWTSSDFVRAFIMNADGSNGRTFVGPVNNAIWDECGPVWSPDGRSVALLGGVFGGFMNFNGLLGIFAVGIVDPATGVVHTIATTGTTCWDDSYGQKKTMSGIAWSPDASALAITRRDPPWPTSEVQRASIAIVDISTKEIRAVIPDAYDPAWSRAK
ncbi:MAG TPA: Ig-like domain-containing protein [Gemmatimonadaceae bacterium]|nr:Ig-like domain-containing protein [Gemmatimonadaceae bacterium]